MQYSSNATSGGDYQAFLQRLQLQQNANAGSQPPSGGFGGSFSSASTASRNNNATGDIWSSPPQHQQQQRVDPMASGGTTWNNPSNNYTTQQQQPVMTVAGRQVPQVASFDQRGQHGGPQPKRRTPNSSSTSGDDSCSSSDRRGNKQSVSKKNRPKRRANDGGFSSPPPPTQHHQPVPGDVGRPPLYSGPNGPRTEDPKSRNPAGRKNSPKVAPLQLTTTHSQWSSSSDDGNRENDEHRLRQRCKQLNFGKVTVGYKYYRHAVPLAERQASNPRHPMTPDASQKCSKRRWDAMVAGWRRALHMWDENPAPESMVVAGAPTLADLGEVDPIPFSQYIRDTEEELQRIAHEVASMHSGGASTSSQTAGETSLEDISSNANDTGNSVNTSLLSQRSNNAGGGSGDPGNTTSGNNSAYHTPKEEILEHSISGAAKTLISVVHVPPPTKITTNAWGQVSSLHRATENSTVTITVVEQDAARLFVELQKHFDITKLFYDRKVQDFPGAYYPENFSAEANASNTLVALDTVNRVDEYLNLAPMLPRLEYHGHNMPQIATPPSQHPNATSSQLPSLPYSNPHANAHHMSISSLMDATSSTGATAGSMLGENDIGREVQMTPTRSLLDDYLQDLTFNPNTLASAPTPTVPTTGSRVTADNFYQAPSGTSESWLSQLRETSPVGTIGPVKTEAAIPSSLMLQSPTKRM